MLLSEYQDFTRSSRFASAGVATWELDQSELLSGENFEFLSQHGPGLLLLMPSFDDMPEIEARDELAMKMADELSDITWFATDTADRKGIALNDLCSQGFDSDIQTFQQLDQATSAAASQIKVINKTGILFPDLPYEHTHTSLDIHPGYVYMRALHRVTRGLDRGVHDLAPYVATELEPFQDAKESLTILFQSMSYIAVHRLGYSLDSIASFNMAKLQHRDIHGKANDLQFSDFIKTYVPSDD